MGRDDESSKVWGKTWVELMIEKHPEELRGVD